MMYTTMINTRTKTKETKKVAVLFQIYLLVNSFVDCEVKSLLLLLLCIATSIGLYYYCHVPLFLRPFCLYINSLFNVNDSVSSSG